MTIIAYDGRVVAADTMMTSGYTEFRSAYRKILPVKKGDGKIHVLTFTGETKFCAPMFEWYMDGCSTPNPMEEEDDGVLVVFSEWEAPLKFTSKTTLGLPLSIPYAIGSGDNHAYALMIAAGFSAERAVESSCDHCAGCGMPIESFDITNGRWLQSIGARACNHDQLRDLARKCKWTPL